MKPVPTAISALVALAGSDMALAAKAPEPHLVSLTEIIAPIVGRSRVEGTLSVSLVLEASAPEIADMLKARMPEVRATALTVTLEFARLYASGFTPVDARRLSADLNAALKKLQPGIARVLIVRLGAVTA
jgi:hypothetical protein